MPFAAGGGLFIDEIRVRNHTAPGPVHIFAVDNMLRNGPQSQGGTAIFPAGLEAEPIGCQITVPGCQPSVCQKEELTRTTFNTSLQTCDPSSAGFQGGANCVVGRSATPLFGLGLVEAVSNQTLMQLAQSEPSAVAGTVKQIMELGQLRVARFGWKDDHATLRGFAGDAYLNEMGITNPDNPREVSTCALNQSQFGVVLQTADGLEDSTGSDGRADIDRFSDFMRALNPPPTLERNDSTEDGRRLFRQVGCAGCHAMQLTTDPNPASFVPTSTGGVAISSTLNSALANQTFHPFSDFLLHDMGSLGDGITSGDIPTAISLHDGQGKAAATAFQALSTQQQQELINFLDTI